MKSLLNNIFINNPELQKEIDQFCSAIPEYVQSEQQFKQISLKIAEAVGFDLFDDFENCLCDYVGRSVEAYYLFGLGLRQELLHALLETA